MMTDEKLSIEITRISFYNPENGFAALSAYDCETGDPVNVAGNFYEPAINDFYIVFGRWSEHRQFGKQFKVERSIISRPNTKSSICRYLCSGLFEGVGPKTAQRIVDHFGSKTFQIFEEDPERIKNIPKLPRKLGQKIIDSWQQKIGQRDLTLFLSKHNIPPKFGQKLLKKYGDQLIEVVSLNPYSIIHTVSGVGFLTADRLARSVGIQGDNPHRIEASILYCLEQAENDGHCFLYYKQLIEKMASILDLSQESLEPKIDEYLARLEYQRHIVTTEHEGARVCYLSELFYCEQKVSQRLQEILESEFSSPKPSDPGYQNRVRDWILNYCKAYKLDLSEDQLSSVELAAQSKIFILTGGPGVGKTTTANTIIRLFKAMGKSVVLAAPTGRAAQRLAEVSDVPAKTIHRLLEWSASERVFMRHKDNPIPAQVVIVDEASMLDIRLASSLLEAIRGSTQLILIGDIDQLPSVGPGNVLRDLIHSNVLPFFRLQKVFRQAETSLIIKTAHAINEGSTIQFDTTSSSDCRFLSCDDPNAILETIKSLVGHHLKAAGYDPLQDVQVLTPMNRGPLGAVAINIMLQELLNPKPPQEALNKIRTNDKVIQNVNNYDLNVFNGDIGRVISSQTDNGQTQVSYGSRQVYYNQEQSEDLSLAYAITIHKSQGSEFKVVIIPMHMSHYIMLQRNLIYTALTRAKKLAIFVGEKKALFFAIKNEMSSIRQTSLCNLLRKSNP